MTAERQRLLSVAVAYGKIAYVFLIDGELKDWQSSKEASLEPARGRSFLRRAVMRLEPDFVVTEDPFGPTRKRGKSRSVLYALTQELTDSAMVHRLIRRDQSFANKYAEARALAERFPAIAPWLPKTPKLWMSEPRNTIYFEALSMAVRVLEDAPQ